MAAYTEFFKNLLLSPMKRHRITQNIRRFADDSVGFVGKKGVEMAAVKVLRASGLQALGSWLDQLEFAMPSVRIARPKKIHSDEYDWPAFVDEAIAALRKAGIMVGKETRGEYLFLEQCQVWLNLTVYYKHRDESASLPNMVERARVLCRMSQST